MSFWRQKDHASFAFYLGRHSPIGGHASTRWHDATKTSRYGKNGVAAGSRPRGPAGRTLGRRLTRVNEFRPAKCITLRVAWRRWVFHALRVGRPCQAREFRLPQTPGQPFGAFLPRSGSLGDTAADRRPAGPLDGHSPAPN